MKSTIWAFLLVFLFSSWTYAMSKNEFAISILKDGNPVREFNGEVAVPFGTEYKIRIKNNNIRRCSATVYIDGAKVSERGDFIIDSTDYLDLERFLDRSLTEGKRFKFVPINHPDVDDSSRVENGIVKVEFRLEKLARIMSKDWYQEIGTITIAGDGVYWLSDGSLLFTTDTSITIDTSDYTLISDMSQVILCSSTSAGATISGGYSSQSFYKVDFEGEDEIVSLQLRMVGIN